MARRKLGERDHDVLPSRYQIGETVSLNFFDAGFIRRAVVTKVHFAKGKVMYDVEVCVSQSRNGEQDDMHTRLHNIDGVFLKDFVN